MHRTVLPAAIAAIAVLAVPVGVLATTTPADAAGCGTNVYSVTRHAGVYGYEEGGALQGLLKYKDAGDTVVGPRVTRSVPHSFVTLGSGTNPYTGGDVALMADSALAYQYCY